MNDRDLFYEALRELERHDSDEWLINALRERLAQPNPKPIAWYDPAADEAYAASEVEEAEETGLIPLYTAPTRREWQRLTDNAMNESQSFKNAVDVVHQFELDLIDEKIAGFVIAAVAPDDSVLIYAGTPKPVTWLRLIGAMHHALHVFNRSKDGSNE